MDRIVYFCKIIWLKLEKKQANGQLSIKIEFYVMILIKLMWNNSLSFIGRNLNEDVNDGDQKGQVGDDNKNIDRQK